MPNNKAGKYFMNPAHARAADSRPAMPKAPPAEPKMPAPPMPPEGGEEHIGHKLMTEAAAHPDGGKHMHVHHDGAKFTTHHVGEDGEVQGPHDHENLESLKDHMAQFFDEEEHEGEGKQYGAGGGEEHGAPPPAHALHGM